MNKHLALYRKFVAQTEQMILDPLKNLSNEEIHHKATEDSWSLIELAEHLFLVESRIFKSQSDKVADSPKLGILDDIRVFVFGLLLRFPLKLKVPVPQVIPSGTTDRETLLANWKKLQQDWSEFLGVKENIASKSAVLKHPVAGWMNLDHCLRFMNRHFQHHRPQARKILSDLK